MTALESRCHSRLPPTHHFSFPCTATSSSVPQLKLPFVLDARKEPVVRVLRFIYYGSVPEVVGVIILNLKKDKLSSCEVQKLVAKHSVQSEASWLSLTFDRWHYKTTAQQLLPGFFLFLGSPIMSPWDGCDAQTPVNQSRLEKLSRFTCLQYFNLLSSTLSCSLLTLLQLSSLHGHLDAYGVQLYLLITFGLKHFTFWCIR